MIWASFCRQQLNVGFLNFPSKQNGGIHWLCQAGPVRKQRITPAAWLIWCSCLAWSGSVLPFGTCFQFGLCLCPRCFTPGCYSFAWVDHCVWSLPLSIYFKVTYGNNRVAEWLAEPSGPFCMQTLPGLHRAYRWESCGQPDTCLHHSVQPQGNHNDGCWRQRGGMPKPFQTFKVKHNKMCQQPPKLQCQITSAIFKLCRFVSF